MDIDATLEIHAKIAFIVLTYFPKIMQSLLIFHIGPAGLQNIYRNRALKCILTPEEHSLMNKLPRVEDFTINLCFKILRSQNLISEPSQNWGILPHHGNFTIADDIQRLIKSTNDVIDVDHHTLTKNGYIKFLYKTENLIGRVNKFLGENKFERNNLRLFPDSCDVNSYLEQLQNCKHIHDNLLSHRLTNKERERISRLALVILELFPQILRTVFQHFYKKSPNCLLMDCQSKKKDLFSTELTMIKQCHSTNSLDSLDTTILCKLFRLLKLLSPPASGWRKPPTDAATLIQDDVERMRCLRNEIVHRPDIAITQIEFDNYFSKFLSISKRIDVLLKRIGLNMFEVKLAEIKTCAFDENNQHELETALKEIEQIKARFICSNIIVYWGHSFDIFLKEIRKKIAEQVKDREFVLLNLILHNVPEGEVHSKIMDGLQEELSTNYIKFQWSAAGCIILCVAVLLDALSTDENLMSEFSFFLKKIKAVGKLGLGSEDSMHVVMIPVEDFIDMNEKSKEETDKINVDKHTDKTSSFHLQFEADINVFQTEYKMKKEFGDIFKRILTRSYGKEMEATLFQISPDTEMDKKTQDENQDGIPHINTEMDKKTQDENQDGIPHIKMQVTKSTLASSVKMDIGVEPRIIKTEEKKKSELLDKVKDAFRYTT